MRLKQQKNLQTIRQSVFSLDVFAILFRLFLCQLNNTIERHMYIGIHRNDREGQRTRNTSAWHDRNRKGNRSLDR